MEYFDVEQLTEQALGNFQKACLWRCYASIVTWTRFRPTERYRYLRRSDHNGANEFAG